MPQNGFHGLFGLATARVLMPHLPEVVWQPFGVGTVLGAMLPDIDMYPTAIAFLAGRGDLVYVIHRTATHSILVLLFALILGFALKRKEEMAFWTILGLVLGGATHVGLDMLFWFTQIDLFWPLSHLPAGSPLLPIVDLWPGSHLQGLAVNVREAFEFAAYAIFLRSLRNLVTKAEADTMHLRHMRIWELVLWVFFAVALVTAWLFRNNPSWQNYVVTTPYLLAFMPYCWLQVWNYREEIARWATRPLRPTLNSN